MLSQQEEKIFPVVRHYLTQINSLLNDERLAV